MATEPAKDAAPRKASRFAPPKPLVRPAVDPSAPTVKTQQARQAKKKARGPR